MAKQERREAWGLRREVDNGDGNTENTEIQSAYHEGHKEHEENKEVQKEIHKDN